MRSIYLSNLARGAALSLLRRTGLCGLLLIVACALLLPAAASLAQTPPTESGIINAGDGHITLNLRDADIRAFIASVADLTAKNFIVDPRVKGNVTVISAAPTDVDGLYDIFLSILKVHGFAAVPSGDVIKIVPDALAKQEGQTPVPGRTVRINDALVTAVIPIRNVNAAELVAILRPLLPQEAHLAGFTSSNTLVVADTAANVRRLMNLVGELDIVGDEAVELVELEHADADDIVRVLSAVASPSMAQGGAQAGMTPFVAYARTNTVLVKSAPATMPRLLALIRSLDIPDRGPDQIEVIALKFASAVDLVPDWG